MFSVLQLSRKSQSSVESRAAMYKHMYDNFRFDRYPCPYCNKLCSSHSHFGRHMMIQHVLTHKYTRRNI